MIAIELCSPPPPRGMSCLGMLADTLVHTAAAAAARAPGHTATQARAPSTNRAYRQCYGHGNVPPGILLFQSRHAVRYARGRPASKQESFD